MLQKTEMVRRGFVNLRTSCYRSSGGPVLLKKCHGRTDFRTGPKVHATLLALHKSNTSTRACNGFMYLVPIKAHVRAMDLCIGFHIHIE